MKSKFGINRFQTQADVTQAFKQMSLKLDKCKTIRLERSGFQN